MSEYSSTSTARPSNLPEFSVSEVSQAIKRTLEGSFERVRVRGEISGFKRAASGHLYMALKDSDAVLDAVCWRGQAGRLSLVPEDGLEVIASGRITSYPGRSKYQIVIDSLEIAGEGALLKLLEQRRKALADEGLFDEDRKRPLPFLPGVIGVVTSPTGAVIRDILHRLAERFPRHVLVWPVLVQGEGAAEQVAAAIRGFNALEAGGAVARPDLLIVARGGGSLEDLWAFNEEVVVRAAAESRIPLISAVGHETDTTLIDFASDRRAPTPTAAAEIAVPVRGDLLDQLQDLERRVTGAAGRLLTHRRNEVEGLGRGLPDPVRLVGELSQRLDERIERLDLAARALLRQRGQAVIGFAARLPDPRQQLRRAGELLADRQERLETALAAQVRRSGRELAEAAVRLPALAARQVPQRRQVLQGLEVARRLARATEGRQREADSALRELGRLLESYSYHSALERGFVAVRDAEGAVLTRAAQIGDGQALELEFRDGRLAAVAGTGGESGGGPPKTKRQSKAPPKASPKSAQGELL
ncbi:exodeoxyribonuclease VII large subunit [Algihabitans albus]|uniref:exodeoxyribonuclease VII large subunit n=1 Tax=Algihabitans albus TaxID=2164067 RepID=UPI000E5D887D|nr:exodeoxyribonuclease VII large subunit [Algihabitans albus]